MWHSSFVVLVVIRSCTALEWQDKSFLSNHLDNKGSEENSDHAWSTWVESYNEEVSKDRSFWASTWGQVESSLLLLQQGFDKKIGMIQRSSNDPISDLSADPDVQAAMNRLQTDLAKTKNLQELVSTRQKSDEEEQKEFKSKYLALWHDYEAKMQKDKQDYTDAKKRYANIEAQLHSFASHNDQQYHNFLQVTSSLMDRESKLISSLLLVTSHQKKTDSENLYRSEKNLYRSRLAFVDFCRDSLKQVQKIVKDNNKVSFAQIAWKS